MERGENAAREAYSIWSQVEYFILYAVENKNWEDVRQWCYVAARLDEYMVKIHDKDALDYVDHFCYALLTDNVPYLRGTYAQLRLTYADPKRSSIAYITRAILAQDQLTIEAGMAALEKGMRKQKTFMYDYTFFSGLLEKDSSKMEEGLHGLLKFHKLRMRNIPYTGQWLQIPAVGYCKLAWMHGFEIDMKSPLIPIELMPIQPNPEYTDPYNFLKALGN